MGQACLLVFLNLFIRNLESNESSSVSVETLRSGSEESPSSDRELCESFAFFVALAYCRCLLLLFVRGMNSSGDNGLMAEIAS